MGHSPSSRWYMSEYGKAVEWYRQGNTGIPKDSQTNLFRYQFFHRKSHTKWSRREPASPWWLNMIRASCNKGLSQMKTGRQPLVGLLQATHIKFNRNPISGFGDKICGQRQTEISSTRFQFVHVNACKFTHTWWKSSQSLHSIRGNSLSIQALRLGANWWPAGHNQPETTSNQVHEIVC